MEQDIAIAEQHRLILKLAAPFDESRLKTAYRKLIRQWHPDRFSGSPQQFAEATEKAKLINVAYEYLSEFLEENGGVYCSITQPVPRKTWSWSDIQPRRRYEGKTYTAGFPDPAVTEIFLRSSHIVSTGYNQSTRMLYIKFSGNSIYRYYDVPVEVFEAFLDAPSHGRFGHRYIYLKYHYERC